MTTAKAIEINCIRKKSVKENKLLKIVSIIFLHKKSFQVKE